MDGLPERDHLNKRDLALEARLLAEAEAGLLIPSASVKIWIDSFATANPLPRPDIPPRSR